ncbi:MAG: helix-turn-helix transcriptional regulator [Lachnospiraceae bacterium]|jgi:transcriptional regulator with XRE-family HTH domain|nr:helix-turn-helix transcriptional regulator [Lachnospiraceae bacterium]
MFHDRLRATRISRGFTLQKTADALDIPLRTYQNYEAGEREPHFALLSSIADFFNVPTDFLLGRDDYLKSLGVSVDVSLECPPRRPKPQKNH